MRGQRPSCPPTPVNRTEHTAEPQQEGEVWHRQVGEEERAGVCGRGG